MNAKESYHHERYDNVRRVYQNPNLGLPINSDTIRNHDTSSSHGRLSPPLRSSSPKIPGPSIPYQIGYLPDIIDNHAIRTAHWLFHDDDGLLLDDDKVRTATKRVSSLPSVTTTTTGANVLQLQLLRRKSIPHPLPQHSGPHSLNDTPMEHTMDPLVSSSSNFSKSSVITSTLPNYHRYSSSSLLQPPLDHSQRKSSHSTTRKKRSKQGIPLKQRDISPQHTRLGKNDEINDDSIIRNPLDKDENNRLRMPRYSLLAVGPFNYPLVHGTLNSSENNYDSIRRNNDAAETYEIRSEKDDSTINKIIGIGTVPSYHNIKSTVKQRQPVTGRNTDNIHQSSTVKSNLVHMVQDASSSMETETASLRNLINETLLLANESSKLFSPHKLYSKYVHNNDADTKNNDSSILSTSVKDIFAVFDKIHKQGEILDDDEEAFMMGKKDTKTDTPLIIKSTMAAVTNPIVNSTVENEKKTEVVSALTRSSATLNVSFALPDNAEVVQLTPTEEGDKEETVQGKNEDLTNESVSPISSNFESQPALNNTDYYAIPQDSERSGNHREETVDETIHPLPIVESMGINDKDAPTSTPSASSTDTEIPNVESIIETNMGMKENIDVEISVDEKETITVVPVLSATDQSITPSESPLPSPVKEAMNKPPNEENIIHSVTDQTDNYVNGNENQETEANGTIVLTNEEYRPTNISEPSIPAEVPEDVNEEENDNTFLSATIEDKEESTTPKPSINILPPSPTIAEITNTVTMDEAVEELQKVLIAQFGKSEEDIGKTLTSPEKVLSGFTEDITPSDHFVDTDALPLSITKIEPETSAQTSVLIPSPSKTPLRAKFRNPVLAVEDVLWLTRTLQTKRESHRKLSSLVHKVIDNNLDSNNNEHNISSNDLNSIKKPENDTVDHETSFLNPISTVVVSPSSPKDTKIPELPSRLRAFVRQASTRLDEETTVSEDFDTSIAEDDFFGATSASLLLGDTAAITSPIISTKESEEIPSVNSDNNSKSDNRTLQLQGFVKQLMHPPVETETVNENVQTVPSEPLGSLSSKPSLSGTQRNHAILLAALHALSTIHE